MSPVPRFNFHHTIPSMRDGVDGKAGEGGARFGAIGRDHLGKLGHHFGWHHQLRDYGPCGPSGGAAIGYGENQPSA
jgi:hypothetical protein